MKWFHMYIKFGIDFNQVITNFYTDERLLDNLSEFIIT